MSEPKERIQKVFVVEKSNKNYWVLLAYFLLLGFFGGHRWYAGRGSWLYSLTLGWFTIGYVIDLFAIIFGMFKDGRGIEIKP